MQLGSFANAGQVIDEVRHGFEHDQADPFWVHWPAWRKFGLGAMLAAGLRWAASFAAAAAAIVTAGLCATGLAGVGRFGGVRVRVRVATVRALGAVWRTGVVTLDTADGRATSWALTGVFTTTRVVVVTERIVVGDGTVVDGTVVDGTVVVGLRCEVVSATADTARSPWPCVVGTACEVAEAAKDWRASFRCEVGRTAAWLEAGATTSTYVASPDATSATASAVRRTPTRTDHRPEKRCPCV